MPTVNENRRYSLAEGGSWYRAACRVTAPAAPKRPFRDDTEKEAGHETGDYQCLVGAATGGDLLVRTGAGNDTIDLSGATVTGKKTVKNGKGSDPVM